MRSACWMLPAVLVVSAGCGGLEQKDWQVGLANRVERPTAETAVEQCSGGDSVNVSPSIALTGGGAVVLAVLLILLRDWRRRGRALSAVIEAVETLDGSISPQVKQRISRRALTSRTADYLQRNVKIMERKRRTKKHNDEGE